MVNVKDIRLGYYCEDDEMNLYGPFQTIKECEEYDYTYVWKLEKIADKDSKINKITIDFETNKLNIDGEKNASIKILDKVLGVGVHSFLPDSWQVVLGICKGACKNIELIGTPCITGECLDEMLYMQ